VHRNDIARVHAASPLESLCRAGGVPVVSVASGQELAASLGKLREELALSCCYPWRLPAQFLHQRVSRCLNIHPSMLPAWRGPDPVFWQLRAGARLIPVTVHEISHRIDCGTPVGQSEVDTDACVTESDVDRAVARRGVALAVAATEPLPATAGVDARGLWHRSPRPGDYRIFPGWNVAHASRFVRLMCERQVAFRWISSRSGPIQFSRLAGESGQNDGVFSINLADGAIRVLMKNSGDLTV